MKLLKSVLLGVFILGITINSFAQEKEYTASMDGWLVNINEAYNISQESGKPILANFTGTDWCIWCKRLRANVFVKDEFKKWAEENVVLLELDFPRRKQIPTEIRQQNARLQRVFKVRGYPTVWIFNLDKNDEGKFEIEALGSTGFARSADSFISAADRIIANGKQ